jgi:hypothetical protein
MSELQSMGVGDARARQRAELRHRRHRHHSLGEPRRLEGCWRRSGAAVHFCRLTRGHTTRSRALRAKGRRYGARHRLKRRGSRRRRQPGWRRSELCPALSRRARGWGLWTGLGPGRATSCASGPATRTTPGRGARTTRAGPVDDPDRRGAGSEHGYGAQSHSPRAESGRRALATRSGRDCKWRTQIAVKRGGNGIRTRTCLQIGNIFVLG